VVGGVARGLSDHLPLSTEDVFCAYGLWFSVRQGRYSSGDLSLRCAALRHCTSRLLSGQAVRGDGRWWAEARGLPTSP
jgi:hypothetical protein